MENRQLDFFPSTECALIIISEERSALKPCPEALISNSSAHLHGLLIPIIDSMASNSSPTGSMNAIQFFRRDIDVIQQTHM